MVMLDQPIRIFVGRKREPVVGHVHSLIARGQIVVVRDATGRKRSSNQLELIERV